MLDKMNFSSNWNGKLVLDFFGDVRLHNPEKYKLGNSLLVVLRGKELGIVKVEAVRTIRYDSIRDALSFLNVGKPAVYQAALLKKFYNKMEADQQLDHIIVGYTQRHYTNQYNLLSSWWQDKVSEQTDLSPQQQQLSL